MKLPRVEKAQDLSPPRKTIKSLFLLFLCVLSLFFLIFWGMGWLANENLSASDLYARTLDGRQESKRMAAVEWSRRLQVSDSRSRTQDRDLLAPNSSQSKRLVEIIRAQLNAPDPLYVSSLVSVLGFSQVPPQAQSELENIFISIKPREAIDLQISLMLAMARLKAPLSAEGELRLLKAFEEADPALRKIAAFTAGVLADSEESKVRFRAPLEALGHDPVSDVRWNAAFSLGRWGELEGAFKGLEELLDLASQVRRDGRIEGEEDEVFTEQMLLSFEQAFRLLVKLDAAELILKLSVISKNHPHLKIRQAALSALSQKL